MSELLELIKRANTTRQPEDSIQLRVAVLATVVVGAVALAFERAISVGSLAVVVLALVVAYWVSYARRGEDNWHLKIAISVFAILALFRFFGQLRQISTLDEVRFPLADLFLWIQVLHGFDLPARKDLNFSLGSSLALMAVAGSISQDLWYLPILIIYFVLATLALSLGHRSEVRSNTIGTLRPEGATGPVRVPRRDIVKALSVTLAAATVLFLVIPQPSGIRTFALPFSLGNGVGLAAGSGVSNPGFQEEGVPTSRSIGTAFYGFNETLNLRVRGDLNDDVVMRIRASGPAMWRGLLFDEYDGVQWKGDETDQSDLPILSGSGDPPFHYPTEFRSIGPRATISQTFYIEAEQPNVIFAAGQPESTWVEETLRHDDLGGLRIDSTLTAGAVYSVVSTVGSADADDLRSLPDEPPPAGHSPQGFDNYLQLPPSVTDRTRALAERITRNAPTRYDKVRAIEAWLAENFRYSIDSPVPPVGQDAVDHFLFDTDVGFCEQFASATIIMLRSLGIPARMVAGYAVGTRNPFTGYYEIKNSDAHTWVDVWFPNGYGWYEFDPTFAIPPAEEDVVENVPLFKAIQFATDKFGGKLPKNLGDSLKTIMFVSIGAVLLFGLWLLIKKRQPKVTVPVRAHPVAGGPVTRAFRRFEEALAARGSPRAPPETAAELLARTAGASDSAVRRALNAFEHERYGEGKPPVDLVEEAVAELDKLAAKTANGDAARRIPSKT